MSAVWPRGGGVGVKEAIAFDDNLRLRVREVNLTGVKDGGVKCPNYSANPSPNFSGLRVPIRQKAPMLLPWTLMGTPE